MFPRSLALLVLVVALATGCAEPREAFLCTESSQCRDGAGTCESTGFCSFNDTACSSGRRYGEHAGETLSETCVINPMGDFDVASAASTSNTSMTVTFSAPPDPAAAVMLANYSVDGLTLSGTPTLAGSTVSFTTAVQSNTNYTVTVSGIARASDAAPLWVRSASFPGRGSFDVIGAVSATNGTVRVMFNGAPDPATGANVANYDIPGLTLIGMPTISGNTVTLSTSPQSAISYTVTATGVTRAGDGEALTVDSATLTGRTSFNVVSAVALNSTAVSVTFDAPPEIVQATTLANYSIPGLTLTGTPIFMGSSVLLATSPQGAQTYTVTVSGVTREVDAEPLLVAVASFSGISTFNVASVVATTNTQITVTFDNPPDATQATTRDNYSVSGLTLSGTPTLSGNTVTITTSSQTATTYTVMVQNVTRESDGEPLALAAMMFTGRASFNVTSAVSLSATSVQVTFNDTPTMAQAATLANYSITGLTLSGTPVVTGSQVTLTTSTQLSQSYTVVVSNVTRASDAEALTTNSAVFSGRAAFNVASVVPLTNRSLRVTFDAAPNAAQATTLANYAVSGLTLSAPVLSGNTVTLTTSTQFAQSYTMFVSNVTRSTDAEALFVNNGSFTGIPEFNVSSAASLTSARITVTFNGAPNPTEATNAANYTVSGLTLSAPSLTGNTVTLTTSTQAAQGYTIIVSGVTRASDGEALTITSAMFTGRAPFNVSNVASVAHSSVRITFDAAPNLTQATTLANYSIPGLTLSGTPILSGSEVTITTSAQSAIGYTATVSNVTRASDSEALTGTSGTFTGRTAFNVNSAASLSNRSMSVTFSHAPTASQATTLANYSVPGLTLSGPTLLGNTVTFTTTVQSAISYTVTVSNVTRAADLEPLTITSRSFTGRAQFNVTGASSATNSSMTVTFSHAPNVTQATTRTNYNVTGLTLSGTPVLSGNTVTITTSSQIQQPYTVTVSNVTRASDAEAMTTNTAMFTGKTGFNVSSATSVNSTTMSVTFDAVPNAAALTLANYDVPGLTLSGTPILSGNTVTITTSMQTSQTYTVTVINVLRNSDNEPLSANTANFTHVTFNVTSAAPVNSSSIAVTFDAPPNEAAATTPGNYNIPGLTVTGTPSLSGNTVTLPTAAQSAVSYTVTVSNVARASDGAILTVANASFTGRAPFVVASATSTSSGSMTVTFSDAPTSTQATTLANYDVPGLTLSGTPLLSGNVVTLTTSAQNGGTYTVTVSNVIRALDSEALSTNTATFTGTALQTPTVTNVAITGTSPDNGTTRFFNTGSVTVIITGTEFTGVSCPAGVGLDDAATLISTRATSCTVNSATQITATFPAGIRTNGVAGWNVQVTNAAGTNSTSTVTLVPHAGLLVSEVFTGKGGGGSAPQREYIELYNPTNLAINVSTLGLSLHIRNATGTDTALPLTYVRTVIPARGFFLLVSSGSGGGDDWYNDRDATYNSGTAELVDNGGVYISLSATAQTRVLDKLGWGTQPVGGFEGTVFGLLSPDNSTQRKPGGTGGAGTDTDVNATDFNPQSTTLSFMNSLDPPQP